MKNIIKMVAVAATVVVGALGMMVAPVAASTTVNCPNTIVTTDREFSITPATGSASCLAYGVGNLSGASGDPLLALLGSSYSFIDKWTTTTTGGGSNENGILTGSGAAGSGGWAFTLLAPTGFVWQNLVLALKSGQGQFDPDWAAFALTSATSGTWAISSQGLSHINLYGQLVATTVPLPAGAPLLLAGLGALVALRRKRA